MSLGIKILNEIKHNLLRDWIKMILLTEVNLSSPQEALKNGLVATEVLMWFYIGEIIGKGGIVGYDV